MGEKSFDEIVEFEPHPKQLEFLNDPRPRMPWIGTPYGSRNWLYDWFTKHEAHNHPPRRYAGVITRRSADSADSPQPEADARRADAGQGWDAYFFDELVPAGILEIRSQRAGKREALRLRGIQPDTEREVRSRPSDLSGVLTQSGKFEVDHLISLELGGSNVIMNLWPQSYRTKLNAHLKDALENRLHWLVCHGKLDLGEAQREIATDWVSAYDKYITHGPKKGTK